MLQDFARKRKLPQPPKLGRVVRTMAIAGGCLNRKGNLPPGHQKLWEGWVQLSAMAELYEQVIHMQYDSALFKLICSA